MIAAIIFAAAVSHSSRFTHNIGPQERPGALSIYVGWHDELDTPANWQALDMGNKAKVGVWSPGAVQMWLERVPDGWPYAYQWSGITRDAQVDIARYPVLMARINQVQGYAHMDIDVLDAHGKAVKVFRSSTVNGPGFSTIDLGKVLDPAIYSLRLRLIVGGPNEGCSATYDWVRFAASKDVEYQTAHPEFHNIYTPPQGSLR